jgi:multicomponent Na+:H+ antiporter subunit G
VNITLELVVQWASWLCLSGGAVFCVIGGIGLLRLPDVYARTHGSAITDTLGAGLILAGLMLQAGLSLICVKLLLVFAFMLLTGPAAGHALVKAAYAHGIRAKLQNRGKDSPAADEAGPDGTTT